LSKKSIFLEIVTQQDLQVKTSKIVAGLEADKTNKLFQAIGYALENNLDSKEAVASVKSGNVPAKVKVSKNEQQKATKQVTAVTKQSRDRTPAKNEVKKVTAQRSIENKTKSNTVSKEKGAVKGKVDSRKLKKVPSKDGVDKSKIDEKLITNGSVESYNSVSPPREESIEKNEEVLGEFRTLIHKI
jgi:TRAF3-interacting protein 1